mmetsp:Transcript_20448/g.52024  ORF Transcript_20448/g.52024 Transcript_20448/m.52024 type:complete len:202 (+) Transcript_20448:110-715(+)
MCGHRMTSKTLCRRRSTLRMAPHLVSLRHCSTGPPIAVAVRQAIFTPSTSRIDCIMASNTDATYCSIHSLSSSAEACRLLGSSSRATMVYTTHRLVMPNIRLLTVHAKAPRVPTMHRSRLGASPSTTACATTAAHLSRHCGGKTRRSSCTVTHVRAQSNTRIDSAGTKSLEEPCCGSDAFGSSPFVASLIPSLPVNGSTAI